MRKVYLLFFVTVLLSCQEQPSPRLTAQEIVNKSIAVSGGNLYLTSDISFDFRDKSYRQEYENGRRVLKRITVTDSAVITDIRKSDGFERLINDHPVQVADSNAVKYGNSINSVHYFAYLPFGLNDAAVNKELLGREKINTKEYYKLKITFDQEGGGDDFEDTYVYWFNTKDFKPDYLAYEFHVNGGGMRFRQAYNERYVNGIRFVDYKNYEPISEKARIYELDRLFSENRVKLLSTITLENITVRPSPLDNCN